MMTNLYNHMPEVSCRKKVAAHAGRATDRGRQRCVERPAFHKVHLSIRMPKNIDKASWPNRATAIPRSNWVFVAQRLHQKSRHARQGL